MMHRFFLPQLTPKQDEKVSLAPIHNQLRRVLRAKAGDQFVVLDNAGSERLMQVESVERRDIFARVMEVRPAPAEPVEPLTLYQCILKTDKFEFVLQKATELGVSKVVPVISARTVARPGRALAHKQTRWETIVREAAEQCGRGILPVVAPVCSLAEAVADAQGTRLLPWEEGEASPGLVAALQQASQPVHEVSVLIGAEGGLEAGEIDTAILAGWQVVTLGERILRAETAAVAALTIVTAALGWRGDAPAVKLPAPGKAGKPAVQQERAKPVDATASDSAAEDAGEVNGKAESSKAEKDKTEKRPVEKHESAKDEQPASS